MVTSLTLLASFPACRLLRLGEKSTLSGEPRGEGEGDGVDGEEREDMVVYGEGEGVGGEEEGVVGEKREE